MAVPGDGAASSPSSGERTDDMVVSRRAVASIANGAVVLIFVQALGALLYALWSLGASVLSGGVDAPQDSRLLITMCSRALTGMGLGAVAGAARAWTKSFWLSFFLHGIWAILAR
jgi:hypothetical protein